jgi:Na+/melibiose symporter-like transporter
VSQGNGSRFGFKVVGALVLVGVVGLIVILMITGEFFAWRITGASIILLAVMLAMFWYFDRRRVRRYEGTT